jgi:hypothetical protein
MIKMFDLHASFIMILFGFVVIIMILMLPLFFFLGKYHDLYVPKALNRIKFATTSDYEKLNFFSLICRHTAATNSSPPFVASTKEAISLILEQHKQRTNQQQQQQQQIKHEEVGASIGGLSSTSTAFNFLPQKGESFVSL